MSDADNDNSFSILGGVALFLFECAYVLLWYPPEASRSDPGMMLILAAECSYMVKIARANVQQKHEEGRTSAPAMLYTRVTCAGLAAVMALSAGLFDAHKIIWVPAFILTAFGKIMWERQHKASTPTAV